MGILMKVSIQEQNVNTLAGVQLDAAQVGSTATGGHTTIRIGREAPVYILTGTATALARIVLDRINAYQGARFEVRRNNAAPPAFGVAVYDNGTGTLIDTIPAKGTAAGDSVGNGSVIAIFDGTAWQGSIG